METITAYRYEVLEAPESEELGTRCSLEPWTYDPELYRVVETAIRVELQPGVRLGPSGGNHLLLYRSLIPYGRTLAHALRDGWCRVVGDDDPPS